MKQVNLHQAKTHLSRLVEEALGGEEVLIAKAGTPLVRLMPLEPASKPRVLGLDQGKIKIADDFDEPMPEFERLFYGETDPA